MNLLLFDASERQTLLPLTFARPVGDLRLGILTIAERWERRLNASVSFLTQDHLAPLFPPKISEQNLLVNGAVSPTTELVKLLKELPLATAYYQDGQPIAACLDGAMVSALNKGQGLDALTAVTRRELTVDLFHIVHPCDLFTQNDRALREDFTLLTAGRTSAAVSPTNTIIGPPDQLFLEPGVILEACTINCSTGPVYFGKDAVILEGCLLRGPLALGEGAVLKMGTKVYGATTLGPFCKGGGEINNAIFQANSNKGHEGYLGNAIIGEWCNLGADTNASNLKNDYSNVKTWSYAAGGMRQTGLQFHGLVMGDHVKVGIDTMFNTGTVVGFSANVFGAGFPPPFVPSFTWGGAQGLQEYRLDRAMATAERVMGRRGQQFSAHHRHLFERVFDDEARYRSA